MRLTEQQKRAIRTGLVLALALCLSACGSFRLYSESRDKQGEVAKTQWGAAKKAVDDQIAAARTNNTSLVEAEVAAHEKSIFLQRDIDMQRVALGQPVKGVIGDKANLEIQRLVGGAMAASPPVRPDPPKDKLCESIVTNQDDAFCLWKTALRTPARDKAALASASLILERYSLELPGCLVLRKQRLQIPEALKAWLATRREREADKQAPAGGADAVEQAVGKASKACTSLAAVTAVCSKPADGDAGKGLPDCDSELGRTASALRLAQQDLADAKEKSKTERNDWRAAVAAYEAQAAKLKPGQTATDEVKTAATKLTKAAEDLIKANDLFGKKFLSESRREAAEKLIADLATATDGTRPAEGAPRVAQALYAVPQAVDKFSEDLKDAKKPLLLVAAMERDRQQALVDVLDKDIKQLETVIGLREAEVEVMTQRAFLLRDANKLYSVVLKPVDSNGTGTLNAMHGALQDDVKREQLYEALGAYYHAQGRLLADERRLRIQRYGLAYETNVNHAEAAVRQWQALIDNSVELLVAFGKSGLKSEQLADLATAVGVLWIGRGVNVK